MTHLQIKLTLPPFIHSNYPTIFMEKNTLYLKTPCTKVCLQPLTNANKKPVDISRTQEIADVVSSDTVTTTIHTFTPWSRKTESPPQPPRINNAPQSLPPINVPQHIKNMPGGGGVAVLVQKH